jgi:hypothetical protein
MHLNKRYGQISSFLSFMSHNINFKQKLKDDLFNETKFIHTRLKTAMIAIPRNESMACDRL